MNTTRLSLVLVALIIPLGPVLADSPAINGDFNEWGSETLIASDPSGDANSVFDVTEVHALNRGSRLFVHFDTSTTLNIQSGPGKEGTLRLELGFPNEEHLTIDLRQRIAYTGGNPNNFISWSQLDYVSLPTYASDRFELRVDVSALGFDQNDALTIDFSGSDSLANPVVFALKSPSEPPAVRSASRADGTVFRIANLNTLSSGLLDSGRMSAIGRLIQAAAADIYCFQEEYSSSEQQITERLQDLDPLQNNLDWNVHKIGDTVVAAQQPVIPVPHPGDAAAIVVFKEIPVLTFSIHPPCCGYIGSPQDQNRIEEMEEIVSTIAALRAGDLGSDFEAYEDAAVMIIGDWNLVGSRAPLDLVLDSKGPGLTHWTLPHLVGDDALTWRDLNPAPGDFPPGLLDLLTHGSEVAPCNGFVLDSTELPPKLLATLGLESNDSVASDHLFLVGDFTISSLGDLNGDGSVGIQDLLLLLAAWGSCSPPPDPCPADLDGNGSVGISDLLSLLSLWG